MHTPIDARHWQSPVLNNWQEFIVHEHWSTMTNNDHLFDQLQWISNCICNQNTTVSPTRDSQCIIQLSSTEEEMFQMKADLTRFKKNNQCIHINDDNNWTLIEMHCSVAPVCREGWGTLTARVVRLYNWEMIHFQPLPAERKDSTRVRLASECLLSTVFTG